MIILNPFAFPKPPTVKITKDVKRAMKEKTYLPEHEESDIAKARSFQEDVNLMKVGLMPKKLAKQFVEEVKKIEEKEAPTLKIEEKVEEKVEEAPPKNKKERKQRAMKEGKDKKQKIEKLEKEVAEAKQEAKKAKEEGKKEGRQEFKKELEDEVETESRRPSTFREKHGISKQIKLSSDMSHKEMYDKLKNKAMLDGEVLTVKKLKDMGLYPTKEKGKYKHSGEQVIEKIKSLKIENILFK